MPGGIGHVDRTTAHACRTARADSPLLPGAGEAEIFHRLSLGKACYACQKESLYFVESRYAPVGGILRSVMEGLGNPAVIEQLHLDAHQLFCGARRLRIAPQDADTVLIALRLAGIEITVLT